MKVFIVEDEPIIMSDMVILLSNCTDIEIVGAAYDVEEAISLINTLRPDIIFLDIQLISGTGFDILDQLEFNTSKVVFITSYQHYAIKAIKSGAFDYLLKPINQEELYETIDKIKKIIPFKSSEIEEHKDILQKSKLCINANDSISYINLHDIIYITSDGPYCHFFLVNNKKITVTKTLKYFYDILPTSLFIRTHQSFIINKNFVCKYIKMGFIELQNGVEIPVATRRKDEVLHFLQL